MKTVEDIHREYCEKRDDLKQIKKGLAQLKKSGKKSWNELRLDNNFLAERISIYEEYIRIIEEHLL